MYNFHDSRTGNNANVLYCLSDFRMKSFGNAFSSRTYSMLCTYSHPRLKHIIPLKYLAVLVYLHNFPKIIIAKKIYCRTRLKETVLCTAVLNSENPNEYHRVSYRVFTDTNWKKKKTIFWIPNAHLPVCYYVCWMVKKTSRYSQNVF